MLIKRKEIYKSVYIFIFHYFPIAAVIPGSNLAYMCTQVKSCVEEEQSKALWVPSGSL